jgi:DNA-binding HxlR family transcriptional regulator
MRRSDCPIAYALDLVGDRWTLLILRDLIFAKKRHFDEILASEERISTNILAERLRKLVKEGLVEGHADSENRRKIIYAPTPKALDLVPLILEMIRWSAKYDSKSAASKKMLADYKKDRESLIRQITGSST